MARLTRRQTCLRADICWISVPVSARPVLGRASKHQIDGAIQGHGNDDIVPSPAANSHHFGLSMDGTAWEFLPLDHDWMGAVPVSERYEWASNG